MSFLLVIALMQIEYSFSQKNNLYFEHYTIEDGLSQNSVFDIAQDSKGFIWIATETGLNRFDGYNFKVYNQEVRKKNSLISGYIKSIAIDKLDRIWIGAVSGFSCFNPKDNTFYLFNNVENNINSLSGNYINSVFVDKEGFVWVGTEIGLNKSKQAIGNNLILDAANIKFEYFKSGNKSNNISNNSVNCFFEDNEYNIWFGTERGLNKYDKKTDKIYQYFYSCNNNDEQKKINQITSIAQLNDSVLFIGSSGGFLSFNINTNLFHSFKNHPFYKKHKLSSAITRILKDSFGNFWIATYGKGLIFYNSNTLKFELHKKNNQDPNSLSGNFINSLFIDNSSTLFVGIYGNGFNTTKISSYSIELFKEETSIANSLSDSHLKHVFCQDNNTIWLGTFSKGLEKFNPNTKKFTHYPFNQFSNKSVGVVFQHVRPENKNNIWIGTIGQGLLLFNHKTGEYLQYKKNENQNSISSNKIYWLTKNNPDYLWIGTFGHGLDKLDLKTGVFKNYNKTSEKSNNISNNFITFIDFDNDSILWITTWGGGLNSFNTKTEKFTHYNYSVEDTNTISSDFCVTIHFDNNDKNILWVGTSTGLNKFNKKTGVFKTYSIKDGLPDLFINSIEEDDHGNLWISHVRGMSRFNKTTEEFINFTVKDGLQNNEFSSGVNEKLPDGRMIFGGIAGFNIFHPDSIKPNKCKANINITNFKIFYNDVEIKKKYNGNVLLKKSIIYTDTIILNYKNNVISFEFVAHDYKNPENIKYAFKLKGFEHKWNFTNSDKRYATYTNLEHGTYYLQIKSTNASGIWNNNAKELVIIIDAPFWLTTWFKILSAIMFILFVIAISTIRTKVLKKQKENLEKQVKERTTTIKQQKQTIESNYEEVLSQKEELKQQAEELLLVSDLLGDSNKKLESEVKKRTLELEIALEKAKDAEKLISSFLSNLSHEIRTPMNAILGFSQILCSSKMEHNEIEKYTEIIEKNVYLLLNQIDNIMEIAKLHSGQYDVIKKEFNVLNLFKELYDKLKPESKLSENTVEFSLLIDETKDIVILSDEESVSHIIFNLVENALKYTEKGYVEFGYKILNTNKNKTIEIFVNDTGIGIDEKEQKIIFNAFSKIETSKRKLYRGTGLGLALVKNLTEKLNGKIELKSIPDKGTKVKILIPI